MSVNIEFSGSTPMEEICNTVSTVDDTFVEDTELFFMSLTTSEPLVTIPVQSVVALILDNDGVFIHFRLLTCGGNFNRVVFLYYRGCSTIHTRNF